MLEVKTVSYNELPEEVASFGSGLSNNGSGKEYASYLLVYHNGKLIKCKSDAMEPEDACFCRDLAWVQSTIMEAYNIGKRHHT